MIRKTLRLFALLTCWGCAAAKPTPVVQGPDDLEKTAQKAYQNRQWDAAISSYEALLARPENDSAKTAEWHYWASSAYSERNGRLGEKPATSDSRSADRLKALEHAQSSWTILRSPGGAAAKGDASGVYGRAGRHYAQCLGDQGTPEKAIEVYLTLLGDFLDPSEDRARTSCKLGEAYLDQAGLRLKSADRDADLVRAEQYGNVALQCAEKLTRCPRELMASIHNVLGLVALERMKPLEAEVAFGKAKLITQDLKDPYLHVQVLVNLIGTYADLGRFDKLQALVPEIDGNPSTVGHPRILAARGNAALLMGQYEVAIDKFSVARTWSQNSQEDGMDIPFQIGLDFGSAAAAQQIGDFQDAERRLKDAEAKVEAGGPSPAIVALVKANRGRMDLTLEQHDKAEMELSGAHDAFRDLRGPRHPDTLRVLGDLANLDRARNHLTDAALKNQQAIEGWIELRGENHPEVAQARLEMAKLHRESKQCVPALTEAERALEILDAQLGPLHPQSVMACLDLVLIALECDTAPGANALLGRFRQEAENRFRQLAAGPNSKSVDVLRARAIFAEIEGCTPAQQAQAVLEFERVEQGFRDLYGSDGSLSIAGIRLRRGQVLERMGKSDDALVLYGRAEDRLDRSLKRHPMRAKLLAARGDVYKSKGEIEKAKPFLQNAQDILKETYGSQSPQVKEFMDRHTAE